MPTPGESDEEEDVVEIPSDYDTIIFSPERSDGDSPTDGVGIYTSALPLSQKYLF